MKTIQISEETYEKIKEQLLPEENGPLEELDDLIGNAYFFRTVTYHMVGFVTGRMGMILTLSDASWVADSGRFMQCIKEGKIDEVEPVGIAYLNLNSVTDFFPWNHDLPNEQK